MRMTEQYERDFKGVWIPKHIWLTDDLGWTEKMLLVEIDSLDREHGCFASNEHFAQFFGLSKDRISKMITMLKRKGYISVQLMYKAGTKQVERRVIRVHRVDEPAIDESAYTCRQKHHDGIGENTDTAIGENVEYNNTMLSNTMNNTTTIVADKPSTKRTKRIYTDNEEPMILAKYLYALIERNNPYAKKPNFQSWANDIRLMHEIDNIEYRVIKSCISWCQQNQFWHKHILSAKKLREKFPTLYLQAQEKGGARHEYPTAQSYADGIDF